jgi:hypothetical protein
LWYRHQLIIMTWQALNNSDFWKQQWCWSYGFDSLFSAVVGCGFGQRTLLIFGGFDEPLLCFQRAPKRSTTSGVGEAAFYDTLGAHAIAGLHDLGTDLLY